MAVLGIVLLSLSAGCVYYNTFYLARRYYREAEEMRLNAEQQDSALPQGARQSYARALEFATRVLVEHPESRWVEDALLLSQKALYHQGEIAASLRKGQELLGTFPESRWIPESGLFTARGLQAQGEPLAAAGEAAAAALGLEGRLHAEALLVQAQALDAGGRSEEAQVVFDDLVTNEKTPPDLVLRARLAQVDILKARGAHADAAARLVSILEETSLPGSRRSEIVVSLIDLLIEAGDLDAADAWRVQLEELDQSGMYVGVVQYYKGLIAYRRGSRRGVEDVVLSLTKGVTQAWEARIRLDIGMLMESSLNWVSAVPEYQVIATGMGSEEQRLQARHRYDAIARLYALRALVSRAEEDISFPDPRGAAQVVQQLPAARPGGRPARRLIDPDDDVPRRIIGEEEPDEQQGPQDLLSTGHVPPGMYLYLLAEHLALEMDLPDSAMVYLDQVIRRYPTSELVPQALFAMYEWAPGDPDGRARAEQAAQRLTTDYADSRWAYLHLQWKGEDPPKPREVLAQEALLRVEESIDPLAEPATWAAALPALKEVAGLYDGTAAARQAELIAAGLLELGAGPPDSARAAYEQVIARFPDTEAARAAAVRLGPGRGLVVGPVEARARLIEEEMQSWGAWFRTLTAAKATRLQLRGAAGQMLTSPAQGVREEGAVRRPGTTGRPPPTTIPPETLPHPPAL